MVNDPEIIEAICVTQNRQFRKDRFAQDLQRVFGSGLLTSEGDFWLKQRRLAQPAFQRERIATYAQVMVQFTERMLDTWADERVLAPGGRRGARLRPPGRQPLVRPARARRVRAPASGRGGPIARQESNVSGNRGSEPIRDVGKCSIGPTNS